MDRWSLEEPATFPTWRVSECACDPESGDSHWILEKHPSLQGYFKIINNEFSNAFSNQIIENQADGLDVTNKNNNADTKYWKFVFDNDDYPDFFKIINLAEDICIGTGKNPSNPFIEIISRPASSTETNSYWNFQDEGYDIIDSEFDVDHGVIFAKQPISAGTAQCNNLNGGSDPFTITTTVGSIVTETSLFTRSHGFTIPVGTEFTTNIPFAAVGKISNQASTSYDFIYGKENMRSIDHRGTQQVTCYPGEIVNLDCVIFYNEFDVPYTITLLGSRSNVEIESHGIFHGASSYLQCTATHLNEQGDELLQEILTDLDLNP